MLLRQEGEAGLKKDTQICPVFPVTARRENPVCRQRGELMGARDPFKKFFRPGEVPGRAYHFIFSPNGTLSSVLHKAGAAFP